MLWYWMILIAQKLPHLVSVIHYITYILKFDGDLYLVYKLLFSVPIKQHIWTNFNQNIQTCDRSTIKIDEGDIFQDNLIHRLSYFTRKNPQKRELISYKDLIYNGVRPEHSLVTLRLFFLCWNNSEFTRNASCNFSSLSSESVAIDITFLHVRVHFTGHLKITL